MLNCSIKAVDVQSMPGGVMILMSDEGSGVGCWFTFFSVRKMMILFLDR